MAGSLGTISGQITLDVRQAVAAYAAVRAANATTLYAMSGSANAFSRASKVTAAGGLAIGAGLGVAIKAAASFEKQLDFFGAVSGATAGQMEQVRAKALQLGTDTVFSAGQIADSFVELGKAGVSSQLIVEGVGEAVAHLGAAADIPLTDAAVIMTSAVQTFSLSGRDAVRVADLLAGAANASIVDIQDLGVSLKYVGGVAASIGLPIEEVVGALGLLGKYGIRGSTAGTSLRQILVSLTGTSKKATAQLEDLGIITKDGTNLFFDAAGKAKPLSDIFQILQDKTKGLTQAQKLAAFKTIFNNRALAAALDLTKEGAAGFAAMNAEIGKTTAAEVSAKRLNNLAGDVEVLRGNIETLLIQAGTPFQNFLRGIVQGLTWLVQAFASLPGGVQQAIFIFLAFAAAGLLITSAITGILSMGFRFIDVMVRLGPAIKIVQTAVMALGRAFMAAGAMMLANPILLIIAALVALGIALYIAYQKSETFRNAVNAVGRGIVTAFQAVVAWFKTLPAFFSGLWASIVAGVTSAWNGIMAFFRGLGPFFSSIWAGISNSIITAFNAVVNFITVTLPGWFTAGFNFVRSIVTSFISAFVGFWVALPGRILAIVSALITGIISFFQQLPYRLGFIIGFLLGTMVRGWIAIGTAVYGVVRSIITNVANFFQELPGRVARFFTQLYTRVVSILGNLASSAASAASSIVTAIVTWFGRLPARVLTFFTQMAARAIAAFTSFRARASSTASSLVTAIINFIRQLPGRVATFFTQMYTRASSILTQLVSAGRSRAAAAVSAVVGALRALPGRAVALFNQLVSRARAALSNLVSAGRSMASRVVSAVQGGLSRLPGAVSGVFGRVMAAFRGLANRAFQAAKSFATGLWNGFKSGLGMKSPSYIERAMWQITGVMDDETQNMKKSVRTMQNLGRGLSDINIAPAMNISADYGRSIAQQAAADLARLQKVQANLARASTSIDTGATAGAVQASLAASTALPPAPISVKVENPEAIEGAPLIGIQQVYNPVSEPSSQTATRQADRAALIRSH